MFEYIGQLFSSLLNMSVFTNDDSYNLNPKEKEEEEKEIKEEKEEEEEEEEEEEVDEDKKISETFQFIEINDDDAFDFFITKF